MARICPSCGALTGVGTPPSDELRATGWNGYTSLYIFAGIFILLIDWFLT
jgi:hypothetical protein